MLTLIMRLKSMRLSQLEVEAGVIEVVPPPTMGATIQNYRRVSPDIYLVLICISHTYLILM